MAELEELLELLPDNTTGEIDAADLREIVTALWEKIEALPISGGDDGEVTVEGVALNVRNPSDGASTLTLTSFDGTVHTISVSNDGDIVVAPPE